MENDHSYTTPSNEPVNLPSGLPAPLGIRAEALRTCMHFAQTGIVACHDAETLTGGVINVRAPNPTWCLWTPVSRESFLDMLNNAALQAVQTVIQQQPKH